MTVQIYRVRLVDGTTIEMVEDYILPERNGIIGRFKAAKPDDIIKVGDPINGFTYVSKQNIICISTGDVRE